MAERYLSDGSEMLLDDRDTDLFDRHAPWHRHHKGYVVTSIKRFGEWTKITFHSLVAQRMGIDRPDHRNRNKLDNRRENLRPATDSQQNANRQRLRTNKSGYKGVSWSSSKRRWRAQIDVNNVKMHLGYYKTRLEAAWAYDHAALKYFGEYAVLNFTREG